MRHKTLALVILLAISLAPRLAAAGVLDDDKRIRAIREEAQALVHIQSILGWYVRTQGEESIFEETYRGHEDLFTADNIRHVGKIAKTKGLSADETRALQFLRFYLTGEFIDRQLAGLYDEVNNAEAAAKVKIEWIDGDVAYRDLDGLLDNEADPEKRKALQTAVASVWENTLNPIHEKIEKRAQELSVQAGYSNYVEMSQEFRMVSLPALISMSQAYIAESDTLYKELLRAEVQEVMGYPLEQFTRSDIGRFAQVPYFNPYLPAELVLPSFRTFLEGVGLDLSTASGSTIFIDEEKRPKKNPRAACFSIAAPRDIRFTVKPSNGLPDFETFFHEGGHALHFANAVEPVWELREMGNNAVTESYANFFEGMWGNVNWLRKYNELAADYNRLISTEKQVPILTDADMGKMLRNRAFWMLYFVRRYAGAKLLYESILHKGDPTLYKNYYSGQTADFQEVYRVLFSDAYGFNLTTRDALRFRTDVDSTFYSADYSRSFFLSAQIEEGLERMFGPQWLDNPETGKFLREKLWSKGNALQADEVARILGYEKLDTGAFDRRIKRMLAQSEELTKGGK